MHTETWKPIPGMPGYEASDQGRIRSFLKNPAGRVLRPANVGRGYLMVAPCVDGKPTPRKVHHLVLLAFSGPRPVGHVACHKNGTPHDNRSANLRWDTPESNMEDRLSRGWFVKIRNAGGGDIAETIGNIYLDQRSPAVVAREYGLSHRSVRDIKQGRRWVHITRAAAERQEQRALASARLLAAAPDLLKAAMQASFALRELLPNDPDAQMTVQLLSDAIKKASQA